MGVLWTAQEAATATKGTAQRDWQASGVSIDSRTLVPGDLFVAIKGPQFDGHDFVEKALEAGAAAVMVNAAEASRWPGKPLLIVSDTETALVNLGNAARERTNATVFGVTGSVGKTTVRRLLAGMLEALGATHATLGNLNNHYGVPLTLARMPKETEYAVIEMGMNHAGEIHELTLQARPHVTIITAVDAVHLEFFDSVAGIARAKAEIFDGLVPEGVAVLPADNPHIALLQERAAQKAARIVLFGEDAAADGQLQQYDQRGWGGDVRFGWQGESYRYHLPQPGRHYAMNSIAALSAIAAKELPLMPCIQRLESLDAEAGRGRPMRFVQGERLITLVDDSYNASPASMRAAFALMQPIMPEKEGRKIALLGDMLELGDDAASLHAGLAEAFEAAGFASLITVGDEMGALRKALAVSAIDVQKAVDADAAYALLEAQLQADDWLLVKGSHGTGLWKIAGMFRKAWHEPAKPDMDAMKRQQAAG